MGEEQVSRSRLVNWVAPEVFVEAARSGRYPDGLAFLRAIQSGELPRPPIAELMDYRAHEFEQGRALFDCQVQELHYNPLGIVHGGVAATLLDTAMGCAVQTLLPITVGYTTLELKLNYLRPMTRDTGVVLAVGEVLHHGKRTAVAEGWLEDSQGKRLAHATTTCLILS